MGEWVFETQGLTVGYRGVPLLTGIHIRLARGQILTLIGPNGSGKSTILKTITGQLPALGGRVMLDGRDMDKWPRSEAARRMAVVLTERIQPEMMTCYDVAAMGRYPYTGRFGALTDRDKAIVRDALIRVRAEELADRDFGQISDGQRQRILLARALCQEPEVLVLDEPTSFLDIRHKIDLLGILLEEARKRNRAVIMSLHEIDLAEKVSDLVMCVKDDPVKAPGMPGEVFTDEGIARLYDLKQGTYLVSRGSVELARPQGRPRVFVIGGAGKGLAHYRALQKMGLPFSAGILFENDMEYDTARSLATRVISSPAFEPISKETEEEAAREMLACGAVLDCGAPVGEMNRANGRLMEAAKEKNIRIVFSAGELQ